jgi:DSF synthase
MSHLHTVPSTLQADANDFTQLTTYLDTHNGIAWGYMHAEPRPCFSHHLLRELHTWNRFLMAEIDRKEQKIHYQVCASAIDGVYNLGGDLDLFCHLIETRDRDALLEYAIACIEPLYAFATHLDRPELKTIALVQGDALGGGFECALAANVLVAERGTKLGLPEILFNLFPGMGALTFLGRRVGHHLAEKIILSGKLYLAEELHEMGVVDVLAEPGDGEQAIYDYIRRESRARNGALAIRAAREISQPVRYEELMQITEIWVDAALRLGDKDLRMMQRLVSRQTVKASPSPSAPVSRSADAVLAI